MSAAPHVLRYRRVLEPLGYEYEIDLSRCREATCALIVRRKVQG